jgi:hypothetical protein
MAVAQVGDSLCVRWSCLDSSQEEVFQVTVTKVRVSKKDNRYSYSLLFPLGETRKTKKLGEIIVEGKKRKLELLPIESLKSLCNFWIPPHRYILAPMVFIVFFCLL